MQYELMELTTGNVVGTYDTEQDALRDVVQAVNQFGPSAAETLALGADDYPRSSGVVIAQGAELVERANAMVGQTTTAQPPIGGNTSIGFVPRSPDVSRPKAIANSSGSGVYRNDFVTGTQRVAAKSNYKPAGKREKIGSGDAARYVRRDEKGHFTSDQIDVGKSLAADRRKTVEHSGPGRKVTASKLNPRAKSKQ
jgi:hypothetical protein